MFPGIELSTPPISGNVTDLRIIIITIIIITIIIIIIIIIICTSLFNINWLIDGHKNAKLYIVYLNVNIG
jgi:hypothetical protein